MDTWNPDGIHKSECRRLTQDTHNDIHTREPATPDTLTHSIKPKAEIQELSSLQSWVEILVLVPQYRRAVKSCASKSCLKSIENGSPAMPAQ
ncbi:hypothetical protein DPMN_121502 [Dreissena polymorpha]|uniref:Uncharacterized protein n=1 Tax=Dreissena polymorpha TaxID=45954 RepID=A0A9D4GMV5_DREPO|nr:hypothetical protein DPMN_121502 [Dreissena polymorpha]